MLLATELFTAMISWLKINWSSFDWALLVLCIIFLLITEQSLHGKYNKKIIIGRPWFWTRKGRKATVKDIPGPWPSLPILGTRWVFSALGPYDLNKVHEAYRSMFARYGNIVKEEALWNYPVISVLDQAAIQRVLKQSGRFPLRPPTELTAYYRRSRPDRYTNLGLVNEQGQTWYNLRTTLTPELTSARTVSQFLSEQNAITDDFIALLKVTRDARGNVVAFEEFANRMGLEVTCSLMLGRRMGFLNDEVDPVAEKLAAAVKVHFCASRDTFYGLPFWKAFPSKIYSDFVKSEEVIYEIISDLVEKALEEEGNTCHLNGTQSVFMSILEAHNLDIRDKKAAIIDFIAAGIQTLGNTLVFLLYLMAKRPDVQKKLREDLRQVMIRGGPLTVDIIKKVPYLRACITEAFRMLPTAPCVARILETDMKIDKYHLNAGTVVLCHTWMACLQDANFEKASEFIPERWLNTEGGRTHSNAFLVVPFGCGRRMCPGKRFVEQELHVVLAKIINEFQLEFDGDLELQFEFLLAPKAPVTMRLIDID